MDDWGSTPYFFLHSSCPEGFLTVYVMCLRVARGIPDALLSSAASQKQLP